MKQTENLLCTYWLTHTEKKKNNERGGQENIPNDVWLQKMIKKE